MYSVISVTVWFIVCFLFSVLSSAVIFVIQAATHEQYRDIAIEYQFHVVVLLAYLWKYDKH